MGKMESGFCTNSCFSLGDEREIDTDGFIKNGNELANFIDTILETYLFYLLYRYYL